MRLNRLLAIPAIALALLSSAALPAFAETSAAACFCYVNGTGATKTDGATDAPSCSALCAKNGSNDAGYHWAKSFSEYPGTNLRCWEKQADCETNLDGDSKGTIDGVWSHSQPAECLPDSHYCYASDTIPTVLQIEIGGTKSVINFADYVGVVYNYLMGFAMTVAIVFLMIGGLRYVIGAGSGDIAKAKKMMTNAVEGFVLLMFAYVILYTVNPQLLRLQVPKLPMLKKVTITSGNDCATAIGLDPTATPQEIMDKLSVDSHAQYGDNARSSSDGATLIFTDTPQCGATAEVVVKAGGETTAPGTMCDFSYCSDADKRCAPGTDKNVCVSCVEVGPNNAQKVVPSAALCASIAVPSTQTQVEGVQVPDTYNYCGYTTDSGLNSAGTCASLSIDCGTITDYLGCGGYTVQVVRGLDHVAFLGMLQSGSAPTGILDAAEKAVTGYGNPNIQDVCVRNPCGVAGGCKIEIDPGLTGLLPTMDCVSAGT